jgi:hypothetical protein
MPAMVEVARARMVRMENCIFDGGLEVVPYLRDCIGG